MPGLSGRTARRYEHSAQAHLRLRVYLRGEFAIPFRPVSPPEELKEHPHAENGNDQAAQQADAGLCARREAAVRQRTGGCQQALP